MFLRSSYTPVHQLSTMKDYQYISFWRVINPSVFKTNSKISFIRSLRRFQLRIDWRRGGNRTRWANAGRKRCRNFSGVGGWGNVRWWARMNCRKWFLNVFEPFRRWRQLGCIDSAAPFIGGNTWWGFEDLVENDWGQRSPVFVKHEPVDGRIWPGREGFRRRLTSHVAWK